MNPYSSDFANIVANMNKAIQKIENNTMKGLLRAVTVLRADMDKTEPMIPVDTNNLRSSWSVTSVYDKSHPVVICGFTARYAAYVHEMYGANFKRPGAGAHFFSAAIKRNEKKILEILKEEINI